MVALHADYYTSSNLAKYPFEVYWPTEKLKVRARDDDTQNIRT